MKLSSFLFNIHQHHCTLSRNLPSAISTPSTLFHNQFSTLVDTQCISKFPNFFVTNQEMITSMMPSLLSMSVLLLMTIILPPCILILLRVLFPSILTHPWKLSSKETWQQKRDKKATVVFAGSFNPPHWGHLVMIRYLAERYGSVICCIGVNPSKTYDVTPQQRAQILREMISSHISLKNVRVDVVSGYIWRHAHAQKAKYFYRGIRTWAEDGADELKLLIQNTYGPMLLGRIWPINTIFLEGDPRYRGVSSTLVRKLCRRINSSDKNGEKNQALEELKQLVPECVVDEVSQVYGT